MKILSEGAIVKELNISKETRELVQRKKKLLTYRNALKEITGYSGCAACGSIPDIQISVKIDGAIVVENYCRPCSEKLYQRMNEPEDRTELAAYYNCELDTTEKLHVPHRREYYYYKNDRK
ncbi:MAG TPA: hypothetical protein VH415_01410 [Nitrososphaeraceae archaeon]|jgi:hypothetical protein